MELLHLRAWHIGGKPRPSCPHSGRPRHTAPPVGHSFHCYTQTNSLHTLNNNPPSLFPINQRFLRLRPLLVTFAKFHNFQLITVLIRSAVGGSVATITPGTLELGGVARRDAAHMGIFVTAIRTVLVPVTHTPLVRQTRPIPALEHIRTT